jgi:hypothetical protein
MATAITAALAPLGCAKPHAHDFPCSARGGCPPGLSCAADGLCHDRPLPARPVAPLSATLATSPQPTLRWLPDSGAGVVTVDICGDRDCLRRVVSFAAHGVSATPPAPLPAGVVFWRVRGDDGTAGASGSDSNGGGGAASVPAVWQLTIPARGATGAGCGGAVPDFDGDGFADLAIGVNPGDVSGAGGGRVQLFRGGPQGVAPTAAQTLSSDDPGFAQYLAPAGDVNGDGFADLAVSSATGRGAVSVYLGGRSGLSSPISLDPGPVSGGFGRTVSTAGDVNGDGFADVLVGGREVAQVFLGSAAGVQPTAAFAIGGADVAPGSSTAADATAVAGGADFNGDGRPDAIIGMPSGAAATYAGDGAMLILQPGVGPGAAGRVAGDANGDGFADYAGGALFTGGPQGLDHALYLFAFAGESFQTAAGDVDGDGYGDVVGEVSAIVGARERKRIYFGAASGCPTNGCARRVPLFIPGYTADAPVTEPAVIVVGVGDLNGDGFADVAAGAPASGHVYLFYGGAAGPAPDPSPPPSLSGRSGFGVSIAGL